MRVNIQFIETSNNFGVVLKEVQTVTEYIGGEVYKGDYVITPKVSEQTAHTAGKVMIEDITVSAIPYFDVGNIYGGSTVYIGSEVIMNGDF